MLHPSDTESIKESIGKRDSPMNVIISSEEMAESFTCNHKYNQTFTQDIFNIESFITEYSQEINYSK